MYVSSLPRTIYHPFVAKFFFIFSLNLIFILFFSETSVPRVLICGIEQLQDSSTYITLQVIPVTKEFYGCMCIGVLDLWFEATMGYGMWAYDDV